MDNTVNHEKLKSFLHEELEDVIDEKRILYDQIQKLQVFILIIHILTYLARRTIY